MRLRYEHGDSPHVLLTALFCVKHNLWEYLMGLRASPSGSLLPYLARLLPQRVIDALIAKKSYYALGIITGLSLFVEESPDA